MSKQKFKNYYLGFDVGSNSVGWSVSDLEYKILRFNKKDMWGSRLFEEAKTAADRRVNRNTRRRLQRRNKRLRLLEDIFAEEIAKVDSTFLMRLQESNLHKEDRESNFVYPIFNDKQYTDKNFYDEYPTIYHLRKDLVENDKKFDIRLLFLAIHHIIKYRGHFIFEGQNFENIKDFGYAFDELSNYLIDFFEFEIDYNYKNRLEQIICGKQTKTQKKNEFKKIFSDKRILSIFNAIIGSTVKFKDIFDNEEFESKINLTEIEYDEKRDEYSQELGEQIVLIDIIKKCYDFMILNKILNGGDTLSSSKVNVYENHCRELKEAKYIFKKYLNKKSYFDFFRNEKKFGNYPSYVGINNIKSSKFGQAKKCNALELNKTLRGYFKNIKVEDEDIELFDEITKKLEDNTFLEKPKGSMNANIPYQVHEMELKKILENQSKYYDFLNKLEDGITIKEKIIKIFSFRIPYYVGPLNTDKNVRGKNTWVVRKDEDNKSEVLPWNFEEKINLEESAKNFIERMTNKCSYLKGENVIPKKSLLYSEYSLLNELNNITFDGKPINNELKNEIINELFKNTVRVTKKKFIEFLKSKQAIEDVKSITGIDNEFNSKLESYNTFKKILGEKLENYEVKEFVEKCIRLKCLYGADKKLFNKALKTEYPKYKINEEEFKKISKLNFNKWGRLSKKFLTGIEFTKKENSQHFNSVLDALKSTNYNLMELLSQNFTLSSEIDQLNGDISSEKFDIYSYVDNLYVSPSVKRSIIQTYKIAEEIRSITKKDPRKVFVEMARGGGEKGSITVKRKDKIKELYSKMSESISEFAINLQELEAQVENYDDNRLRQKKLFLYFMQLGKEMYSDKDIDLKSLNDSNVYDIEHIYPQSKLKDDSFDNICLVSRKDNIDKGDGLVKIDVINKRKNFWKLLRDKGFISIEKYYRLTRTTPFTNEELTKFVARQLVTTRQSTLEITKLFKIIFPETEVVYSKAGLVSEFREKFDIIKVRELNDSHHAQDAYLNIVVGNVHNVKFTKDYRNYLKQDTTYNFKRLYEQDITRGEDVAWVKNYTINTVKEMCNRKTANITEMLIEGKGQLFNLTVLPKLKEDKKGKLEIISNVPKSLKGKNINIYDLAEKYGYFGSLAPAYFVVFKHLANKKEVYGFDRICITEKSKIKNNNDIEKILEIKGYKNVTFIRKVLKNQKVYINDYPYRIKGLSSGLELKNAFPLYLDNTNLQYAKNAVKFSNENEGKLEDKYTVRFLKKKNNTIKNENLNDALNRLDIEFVNLYNEISKKMDLEIYKKYINNEKAQLIFNFKDEFLKLNLLDKSNILLNILSLLGKKTICNLSKMSVKDLNSTEYGRIRKSFESLFKLNLYFVDESITGLFVKKEELK